MMSNARVATVREKYLENEFFSRSGNLVDWGLLLKERFAPLGSKFFPLRVIPKFEVIK